MFPCAMIALIAGSPFNFRFGFARNARNSFSFRSRFALSSGRRRLGWIQPPSDALTWVELVRTAWLLPFEVVVDVDAFGAMRGRLLVLLWSVFEG
jgi:hypothetical protein